MTPAPQSRNLSDDFLGFLKRQAPGRFEYEDVYPPVVEGCEYTPLSYEHVPSFLLRGQCEGRRFENRFSVERIHELVRKRIQHFSHTGSRPCSDFWSA